MDELKAEEELGKLKGQDGKVDQEKLAIMNFKYLLQVDQRLDLGAKKMEKLDSCQVEVREKVEDLEEKTDRCPFLRGDKSLDDLHPAPPANPGPNGAPKDDPPGKDILRISGLVSTKTLLKVAGFIAALAVGGGLYAHFLGGI